MSKPTQIGWYTLKADKVFRNTYECAAWYEDVLVKAGKYPVVVYDLRVLEHQDPRFDGQIEGHIGGTYTHMDGTIVSDEFGARFFGVPVGDYDNSKNAGKPSSHSMMVYMHEVADSELNDPESPWELFPEYEARAIQGEWDGEPYTTYAIYKAGSSGATKMFWCVTSSYDDQGRVAAAITDTKEAASKPQQTYTSTGRKDIYHDWFDSKEEAKKFVEDAKKA